MAWAPFVGWEIFLGGNNLLIFSGANWFSYELVFSKTLSHVWRKAEIFEVASNRVAVSGEISGLHVTKCWPIGFRAGLGLPIEIFFDISGEFDFWWLIFFEKFAITWRWLLVEIVSVLVDLWKFFSVTPVDIYGLG